MMNSDEIRGLVDDAVMQIDKLSGAKEARDDVIKERGLAAIAPIHDFLTMLGERLSERSGRSILNNAFVNDHKQFVSCYEMINDTRSASLDLVCVAMLGEHELYIHPQPVDLTLAFPSDGSWAKLGTPPSEVPVLLRNIKDAVQLFFSR